ncbi:MAG: restriction endonuclease subunit S [Nitrospinae bacterium]|nr:restriction endonuclease subunit S [Nitrospinota bacterium]
MTLERYELPEGWKWKRLSDPEVCLLNPKKSELKNLSDSTSVTFVPMAAVDEVSGTIAKLEVRRLDEVRKGYTYFAEGDVIFAKITPCMENGKSAIARKLTNGVGFGSTEFHVLRPLTQMIPEWLHMLVRSKIVRDEAKNSMYGAAGQQRVPIDFFKELEIPIPPLPEQRRIVKRIEELTRRVEATRKLIKEAESELAAFTPALLSKAFRGAL